MLYCESPDAGITNARFSSLLRTPRRPPLAARPLQRHRRPRPIGWISSRSTDGALNLAPYSFFNAFNYTPPIVGFASIGYKDTVRNIEQTGEFAWNLVTRPLAEAMNQTCAPAPPEISEFALTGLTPLESRVIAVPRVAESPVSFECRCTQIVQLQGASGEKIATWLVLGEVGKFQASCRPSVAFMRLF